MGDFLVKATRLARATLIVLAVFICGHTETVYGQDTLSSASVDQFVFLQDDTNGKLSISLGAQKLFVYNYGPEWELPHFYPLNTPSGKNLLVEKTEPYPHHRAFWVADTVARGSVRGDVYNAYYSGTKANGKNKRKPPFDTGSRHVSFQITTGTAGLAYFTEDLVWETSRTETAYPLLDEHREIRLVALSGGDYLMDFAFELRATYGDVQFVSDAVHYAWPFLRINETFSGDNGGTITAQNGAVGQESTNMLPLGSQPIMWMDYSNPLDGEAEGVTIFQHPDPQYGTGSRKWLTREYGTFGPRRPDEFSGAKFTLKKGDILQQRVGIYVHRGDALTGNVADVYAKYIKGVL